MPFPDFKPATEDTLLAMRVIEHPITSASVMLALRDALMEQQIPTDDRAMLERRDQALRACQALADRRSDLAQRLISAAAARREQLAEAAADQIWERERAKAG